MDGEKPHRDSRGAATCSGRLVSLGLGAWAAHSRARPRRRRSTWILRRDHAVQSFVPTAALGAGIDRISTAATDKLFDRTVLEKVLEAGWQTVSYRQNTELHVEAWHWNPAGTWSDPSGKGYFTGSVEPAAPVRHSFGYFLPHRGFTRNDGTESGYSRLTDRRPRELLEEQPLPDPAVHRRG